MDDELNPIDMVFNTTDEWIRLEETYPCDLSNAPGSCPNKAIKVGHKVRHIKSWQSKNHPETGQPVERVLARNYICKPCWKKIGRDLLMKHHTKAAKTILQQEHMAELFNKKVDEPTEKEEDDGNLPKV